jgi:hypothetical protein
MCFNVFLYGQGLKNESKNQSQGQEAKQNERKRNNVFETLKFSTSFF